MRESLQHARIIIIGGGIIGCSVLYHLARAGCREALLIERAELTAGATWHAAGNVHNQNPIPNLSTLQAYSMNLYDSLATEIGQEVGSHVVGGFFLAQSRERMEEFKFLAGKFKALGLRYELVGADDIRAKFPMIRTDDLVGGAWDPDEGYVDPHSVAMGLATAARRNGAKIVRNTRVTAIHRLRSGLWRLRTDREIEYECEIVVNAAGFWGDEVAAMVGAKLPIVNMEHHYLVTDAVPEVAAHCAELPLIRDTDAQFYLRQEGKGLLFGAWEQDCRAAWGGESAPWDFGQELFSPDLDRMEPRLAAIYHRVPMLAEAGIKRIVNGAISFSPDGRGLIGPLPGVPNFFVACGFLSGIAQGGGIGLALSEWILHGETAMDLSFMDVARYGDWSHREFARARVHDIFPLRYEILYPHLERDSGRPVQTTPIYRRLLQRGAVMGQARAWERPLWFAPEGVAARDQPSFARPNWWRYVGEEARATHTAAALFELSSYSKWRVTGADAEAFLNRINANRLPPIGKIALGLMLNQRGGIIGDLVVARLADNDFYLVGATLAEGIYQRWMERHKGDWDVSIRPATAQIAALGLSGPAARRLLSEVSDAQLSNADFPFMHWRDIDIQGTRCRALRLSYAGELGWELHCPMDAQPALFDALTAAGARHGLRLAGSRALSHLRLEKGYRSWGAEISAEITPMAAGLDRFCRLDLAEKSQVIGGEAVSRERQAPPPKSLATVTFESPNAAGCWGSEPIVRGHDCVGYITSGGYGWRTDQHLAVGWLSTELCAPGTELSIEIMGARCRATVVADPVYDPENTALRS
ncbi:MAG: GcvT family protein [bacterium]